MTPHPVNKENNFIAGWTPADTDICDKLIDYFNTTDNKGAGVQRNNGVDKSKKDSTDTVIEDYNLCIEYANYLQSCVVEYINLYPWVDKFDPWSIAENINIQHYAPGQGFHVWHTERGGAIFPGRNRHLVYMTYLNDVTDQGETEWFHQKVKIQPQRGLTVFWPADWTFVHRGIASPSQEKYIATGWYSYVE